MTISARGFRRVEPTEEPEKKPLTLRQVKSKLKEALESRDAPDIYSDLVAELASDMTTQEAMRFATHFAGGPLYPVAAEVYSIVLTLDEAAGSEDNAGYWKPDNKPDDVITPEEREEQQAEMQRRREELDALVDALPPIPGENLGVI